MKRSGKILVVDNDDGVCAFIEVALRHEGFSVFVANSGKAAISLFREQEIDIVLMDVKMPNMGGPETLKVLQSIRPDVRCYFMTASAGITKVHLCGAIDVFEKPFRSFSEVVGIFSKLLDNRNPIEHSAHLPGEAHFKEGSSKTPKEN